MNSDFLNDETIAGNDDTIAKLNLDDTNKSDSSQISNNCHITGELGKGGMATVYEAKDILLERNVAVKIPLPKITANTDYLKNFFYEAKVLAQMDHPGIIPIYEAGSLKTGGYYYSMKKLKALPLTRL